MLSQAEIMCAETMTQIASIIPKLVSLSTTVAFKTVEDTPDVSHKR